MNKKPAVTIEVRNLAKAFGTHIVLNSVSLIIQPGEIFIIMGPSGAGKSILLKLLSGLDTPTSGEIYINGIPLQEAQQKRQYVLGLVFQAGALFNSLSVFDNLALYFREHRICSELEIAKKIDYILTLLNLKDTASLMPADLSGGMKKRVAIARGLLMEPDVLLFDEPTSELDPTTAASIIELINNINHNLGITTVIASHDILLTKTISHHVGILQNGTIDQLYTPESLKQAGDPFIKNFLNPPIQIKNPSFNSF